MSEAYETPTLPQVGFDSAEGGIVVRRKPSRLGRPTRRTGGDRHPRRLGGASGGRLGGDPARDADLAVAHGPCPADATAHRLTRLAEGLPYRLRLGLTAGRTDGALDAGWVRDPSPTLWMVAVSAGPTNGPLPNRMPPDRRRPMNWPPICGPGWHRT
ncbi:hypothetical protein [Salinispora vitiensis]|uniref:hypothetical protein n=1 Tax=Salinispora vitiensis TaxID=999544 RepID=UPI00037E3546|nr:hypothetical protein [Salinispora vitiensis]